MAELVPFPKRPPRPVHDLEAANRELIEEKYRVIKTRLRDRPRMSKASEREIVAANICDLLTELEEKREPPIRKREVAQAAHLGGPADSTKRLYYYVLPQALDEAAKAQRKRTLTQTTRGYCALLDAASHLSNRPPAEFYVRVFEGTSYLTGNEGLPDQLQDKWVVHLRLMIQRLGEWIIERNDLREYFKILSSGTVGFGLYGPEFGALNELRGMSPAKLIHNDFVGSCLPAILIDSDHLQHIEGEILAASDVGDANLRTSQEIPPGLHPKPCRISTQVDLRLCIAPIGPEGHATPAFEKRIVTIVTRPDKTRLGQFEDYIDQLDSEGRATKIDEWQHLWLWKVDEEENEFDASRSGWWFRATGSPIGTLARDSDVTISGCRVYKAVTLSSIYQLLRDMSSGVSWLDETAEEDIETEAPRSSLAAAIEKNLYVGQPGRRLDDLLDASAKQLTEMIRSYLKDQREKLENLKASTLMRWND